MQTLIKKIEPIDIIGLVVICFGFVLLAKGIDHIVGGAVIMVVTYYFSSKQKNADGKNQKNDRSDDSL